jgi:hypothetical protein
MTSRIPIYDSGMLIALADRKAKSVKLHEVACEAPHRPIVPGPVLAQVWRPTPGTVHALGTVLRDCTVPQARNSAQPMRPKSAGQAACIACSVGIDIKDWQRIGTVLGTAELPAKKRPDAVDALVALIAVRHISAVVFTSDPEDVSAYLAAFAAQDVHVVTV